MITKISSNLPANNNVYSAKTKSQNVQSFQGVATFTKKNGYVEFMQKCSAFYDELVLKKWQSMIGSELHVHNDKATYAVKCSDSYDSELKEQAEKFAKQNDYEFEFGPNTNPTVQ